MQKNSPRRANRTPIALQSSLFFPKHRKTKNYYLHNSAKINMRSNLIKK